MPSMRTNLPPTEAGPSARSSLRRALLLSVLLVIVWSAIAFLPDPELPIAGEKPLTEESATAPPAKTTGLVAAADQATEIAEPSSEITFPVDSGLLAPAARSLFGPGYMLVLALLAIAGAWALWLRAKKSAPSGPAQLTEIGQFKLGPQQQIQLVRCAGEVLLLGVANGSINLLKAYPADEFPDEVTQVAPESPSLKTALVQIASSFRATHTAKRAERAAKQRTAAVRRGTDRLPSHPSSEDDFPPGVEIPEWTIATASAISDGPDFMHVLRRYASKKTYKANTLYPPTGASN